MTSYFNAVVRPSPLRQWLATFLLLAVLTCIPCSACWGFDGVQQAATDRGLHTHLFINVPPEERAPGSLGDVTKAALLKAHIDEFNAVLDTRIAAFEAANPGASILIESTPLYQSWMSFSMSSLRHI